MKAKLITIFSIFLFLSSVFISCNEEEVLEREYPRINTLEVTNIEAEAVQLNADFKFRGEEQIIEYGFIWNDVENPTLNVGQIENFNGDITTSFSKEVKFPFKRGVNYFVKAFIKTNDFVVYGNQIGFQSLGDFEPVLEDFFPKSGVFHDTINLIGTNFSNYENQVKFLQNEADIVFESDTLLKVLVPDDLVYSKNKLTVTVQGKTTATLDSEFSLLTPILKEIIPSFGKTRDTIRILSENIDYPEELLLLRIFDTESNLNKALKIIEKNENSISFIVPTSAYENSLIKLKMLDVEESIPFKYLIPKIISFPDQVFTWNDTISIITENFYEDKNLYNILFNNRAVEPIFSSETLVKTIVPLSTLDKNIKCTIIIAGFLFERTFQMGNPVIEELSRNTANFEDTISIKGKGFHPTNNNIASIGNVVPIQPFFQSDSLIKFILPKRSDLPNNLLTNSPIEYTVRVFSNGSGSFASNGIILNILNTE